MIHALEKGPEQIDHPEILYRLFFPRREFEAVSQVTGAVNHFIKVAEGVSLGCRFYPGQKYGPNILYFHGNGETVPDYDYVAPLYMERGLNLFVTDYRGYGFSNGSPTCSTMIRDAHPIFQAFVVFLRDQGFEGDLFVMGRSLGSAPAIEVAHHFEKQLKGLIVESGFASQWNQLLRLGVTRLFTGVKDLVGFGNDLKIKGVTIPTLIIHGEEDEIIPAEEGRALYALSGAADKASLFMPYAGHNDLLMEGQDEYMGAIERFTKKREGVQSNG